MQYKFYFKNFYVTVYLLYVSYDFVESWEILGRLQIVKFSAKTRGVCVLVQFDVSQIEVRCQIFIWRHSEMLTFG